MKLSKLWLQEWVKFTLKSDQLAHQLTMAGLEVDAVNPVAGEFSQVLVAKVLKTSPHPNADKLTLCDVEVKDGVILKIVCGAANVRPALKVALAMIGAKLPNGLQIKESKLRGELSQGMLCSASELGLVGQSEGIMELDDEAPIGMDLRQYLLLDDEVFDIDLTPNRADCFSVLGVAREIAILNKLPLLEPTIPNITPTLDNKLAVQVENAKDCPRYCGRIIRQIDVEAITPLWMVERLRRSGIRVVNPVVDVMNYVMLELGQPMHAFDLAAIEGDINVRLAKADEQLTLLDNQTVTLDEKILVIADAKKPLAMAGIMGGLHSAVQSSTQDIFIESAFFNPLSIVGNARKYGLCTDASQRYERGVDPNLPIKALERASALLLAITGGEAGPIREISDKLNLPQDVSFSFNTEKVEKLTGLVISISEIKLLLEGLGIIIKQEVEPHLTVLIPSHRFDLRHEVDLVEEVIRLYGYDKLIAQPTTTIMQTHCSLSPAEVTSQLSSWFKNKGYHETISYSFVDPELQQELYPQREFMQLINPISAELSQMRAGMWPGLIASLMYNVHRQQHAIKFFEVGVVFDIQGKQLTERASIGGILSGEYGGLNWSEPSGHFDFYDLKGDLQSLFSFFKIQQVDFIPKTHEALHPGQSAQIYINQQPVGWIGVLNPRLSDALELAEEVLLFELAVEPFIHLSNTRYKAISKYPQIRRDLSFLVDKKVSASQIEGCVRACAGENWLKGFHVFDVYGGKEIPQGKKSLAIALTLQDDTRTLVDAEINSLIDAIIKALTENFSIQLRD